jgi:iron(III) transport system ATP-binding protein
VLDDLSLTLDAGECLVLAGESGSGKTSLLRLVGGLDRADRGVISIGNKIVENANGTFVPPERRGLGMVFQDFALWPHLSVLENVTLAIPGRGNHRSRAFELLERMGVASCGGRLPSTLSGGQQQRVGIARALAAQPRLLLLDEPFSSLDLETRETLRVELRRLIRDTGLTALCVSHDPMDCTHLADRIAVLEAGRISQCATPENLYTVPASAYAARLAGLAGGVVVRARSGGGKVAIDIAGETIHLPNRSPTGAICERARIFWPEGAIRLDSAGTMVASCHSVRFIAGAWCALYEVAGVQGSLSMMSTERPTLGEARLIIEPGQIYVFADDAHD